MATPQPNNRYEPTTRTLHKTIRVGSNVYMWAGAGLNGMPRVHDSQEKRRFLSCVEVFHSETGDWTRQPTSGAPPLGVRGYGCTAVGDALHFFGGGCNHDDCFHNSIHSLSTSSLHWVELSPTTSEGGAPMRKRSCGTVAFKDGEEDILYIVAGRGPTLSYHQPGAQYEAIYDDRVCCNEQHMFSLSTREWSSPNFTGQPPLPLSDFTLTPVGERKAALFGGESGSEAVSDDLLIVELSRDTVHWTRINKPINRSVEWPERRKNHATTCVSGPLLVIVGGRSGDSAISDCWIGDLTTNQWKKLSLPDSVTERCYHSLSALQLSPHSVLLVIFGGCRSHFYSDNLSHTALIELILQEDGGQWVVGRILEGAALEDKRVYQQMYREMIQYNGAAMESTAHSIHCSDNTSDSHELPPLAAAEGATPTLLDLMAMKGADGEPLRVIDTIAAGNYKMFGMYLLQDKNGTMVDVLKKNHIHDGVESVTQAILQKWLTSDAPTRTYQHLIECLRQSELGALAELIRKHNNY